jgi:hypothetical protein
MHDISYYRRPSKCLVILYADARGLTFLKPFLEARSTLRNTICNCKRSRFLIPYGNAAVILLISRVRGLESSPYERKVWRGLSCNPYLMIGI